MTATVVAAVLGAIVLSILVTAALGGWRLRVLSGRIGSFECAARAAGRQHGEDQQNLAWTAGIAHYGAGRIDWWRSWSLAPWPAHAWRRGDLEVVSRARFVGPGGQEQLVARCRCHDAEFELTMSVDAFAGLTAWLEAAPPSDISRVI